MELRLVKAALAHNKTDRRISVCQNGRDYKSTGEIHQDKQSIPSVMEGNRDESTMPLRSQSNTLKAVGALGRLRRRREAALDAAQLRRPRWIALVGATWTPRP
jgi:hypothetical protein